MRIHRFYVQQPLGEELIIDNKEMVHQWFSVFRYKENDLVLLFSLETAFSDYVYTFVTLDKKRAVLRLLEKRPNVKPPRNTTLFVALSKREAFETTLRQATELLITHIVPILSTRSEKKSFNKERLEKILIESAEQSGRGDIPMLHDVIPFKEAISFMSSSQIIGDTTTEASILPEICDGVWVGPEGGWTEEEIDSAKENNVTPFKITASVLRADTASVALIAKTLL
jgi:16S rRNA (uracil1498-N3)-methyltransferase